MFLTVDFESYYAKDFGFKTHTTEEYIRGDQFEVIGVAVQVDDTEPVWFSGTKQEIKTFLDGYDWGSSFVLAHNAIFDGAILNWHFNIRPRAWLDTLSMGRALHGVEAGNSLAKLAQRYELGVKGDEVINALGKRRADFSEEDLARYGEYCKNDVTLTFKLFNILMERFSKVELRLIDLTVRMFTEPALQLNTALLEQHLEEVCDRKEKLIADCVADKDTLMSNPKFAELLKSFGVNPPMKISQTTGKETYAFAKSDEGLKELMDHPDERVQAVVAARLGTKSTLEETRTQRFIDISKRGSMPVPLKYYAAHTGRWGGSESINLQNLPRKSILKQAIIPPPGYVVINSDSSQIEARTLAWLAGQKDLCDAFERGEDVYRIMAAKIYNKDIHEIDDDERFVGKTTLLGCGYSMGAKKFKDQLMTFGRDIPLETCERIIDVYRRSYPAIPKLWKDGDRCLRALLEGKASTFGVQQHAVAFLPYIGFEFPNNMTLGYKDLKAVQNDNYVEYTYTAGRFVKNIYGGKVVENCCQAIARCVIGEQMLMVAKKYKVALTVHDAVVCLAKESELDEALEFVTQCMKWRPKWCPDLPLNCETKYGESYDTKNKYSG